MRSYEVGFNFCPIAQQFYLGIAYMVIDAFEHAFIRNCEFTEIMAIPDKTTVIVRAIFPV